MKLLASHIALFCSLLCFAQNEQLANYYFEKGDFEKAKISYEELAKNIPQNNQYFLRTIECYQQLQLFDLADKNLQNRLNTYNQASLLVELGYNQQLQKNNPKAKIFYDQATDKIKKNTNEVYAVAAVFEKKQLLDYALKSYQLAMLLKPSLNFNYQIGMLHGQLGDQTKMIDFLLTEAYSNQINAFNIKNLFARYISGEGEANFTDLLRKALVSKAQETQDVFWNDYLSWFFVQQKEFLKAFTQEKAIFKRDPESFHRIVDLGQLAMEEQETESAKTILEFVLANTTDKNVQLEASTYLVELKIKNAKTVDYDDIRAELNSLLNNFQVNKSTLNLQLLLAKFEAFYLKNTENAKNILKKSLELPLTTFEQARTKMALADVFLYDEKFNQALLYYSQIELDVKNDEIAHEATLKAAKTSYFKGDFEWALKQFSELKAANTQLVANDALEYFLLINDNTVADSTQTALKAFAKGDYLLYQNRNQDAKTQFETILKSFKGKEIEAITLLRLGKVEEKLENYEQALLHYKAIIENYPDGIYADEAYFFTAEIYRKTIVDIEKAKQFYEKIIFKHPDSIYFMEARKQYRILRGDAMEL